jgi:hypothetical protein
VVGCSAASCQLGELVVCKSSEGVLSLCWHARFILMEMDYDLQLTILHVSVCRDLLGVKPRAPKIVEQEAAAAELAEGADTEESGTKRSADGQPAAAAKPKLARLSISLTTTSASAAAPEKC